MWDVFGQPSVDSAAMTHQGQPRCYDFFLEHRKCWANADKPTDCLPQRKDYIECIYLAKEQRRARDVVERAAKLREQRQKEEKGRDGRTPELGLVSAIDIPDEPTDYPDNRYPDDVQSRGMGFRGAHHIRSWASEKAQKPVKTEHAEASKPEGEDNVPPAQG